MTPVGGEAIVRFAAVLQFEAHMGVGVVSRLSTTVIINAARKLPFLLLLCVSWGYINTVR